MRISSGDLLETFRDMTLLELSAFIKDFEREFGVTATAPVQPVPADVAVVTEAVAEPDEFEVTLQAIGERKVQVIKALREIAKLGLGESKALAERAPVVVLERAGKDEADAAYRKLITAGARVVMTGLAE